jgi:hypothetical protein
MITEDFNNKLNALFPEMTNANTLGSASGELWKGVSEKYTDSVKKILAPVASQIMDVQTDLQVRNPDACPVVQVEVIHSMGGAMIDGQNWDNSEILNQYVDVKLHRISRPFKLTAYDIMKGERIESKVKAAMETVATGVTNLAFDTILDSATLEEVSTDISPEYVANTLSSKFGFNGKVDTLILAPAEYSKLVPTNGLSLDPKTEGVYGIGHIYESMTTDTMQNFRFGWAKDGLVGAVATPEILFTKVGQGMQYLGEIGGIPMVLISSFDYKTQTVMCSVETLAGFAVADVKKVFVERKA